jgi:hypothetical protein
MDTHINNKVTLIEKEPENIILNLLLLQAWMDRNYFYLSTSDRINRGIKVTKDNNETAETRNGFKKPSAGFWLNLQMTGVNLTFVTNNAESDFLLTEYAQEVTGKYYLYQKYFFKPNNISQDGTL